MLMALGFTIAVQLAGTFADVILGDSPAAYWRLNESAGTAVDDASPAGLDGVSTGVTLGATGALADGSTGYAFDGVGDFIDFDDVLDFAGTASMSWAGFVQITANHATQFVRIVSKEIDSGGTQGWLISVAPQSDGSPRSLFFTRRRDGVSTNLQSTTQLTVGVWHHVVVTYDGTNMRMYIDGVEDASSPVASSLSLTNHANPLTLGCQSDESNFFNGVLDEVAVFDRALSAAEVSAHYEARLLGVASWTDIADDAIVERLSIRYGITGNRPTDCLAGSGECSFTLDNSAGNDGSTLGWYSPLHASVRSGWAFGIPIRVTFTFEDAVAVTSITRSGSTATVTTTAAHGLDAGDYVTIAGAAESEYNGVVQITVTGLSTFTYTVSGTPSSPATGTITATRCYVKFRGKVDTIDPEPGEFGTRRVHVVAYDGMRDLIDTDVRDVDLQVNQYEDQVIGAVLDALPATEQPVARDLDEGLDLLPFALDDLGAGAKAASVLRDVILSSYGLGVMRGDGTFRYISRNTRATTSSSHAFDNDMHGLQAPNSLANVYNRVRTTTHPKTIDDSARVLYALTGRAPLIPAGDTVSFEGTFRDPDDPRRLVGGTDFTLTGSPPSIASGTDYAANSQEDGLGTDLTGDIAVAVTIHASRVEFAVTNGGSTAAYLVDNSGETLLQIRGIGIYDDGPRRFTASSVQAYGERPIEIDLPYLDDDTIGQQIADFILGQYEDHADQVDSLSIFASASDALLRQGLDREPGDVLTISEDVTGLDEVDAMILSCQLEYEPGDLLRVTWGLGPVVTIEPPDPPTGLAVSARSDESLTATWDTGEAGAYTQIYVDGIHVGTAGIGVETFNIHDLERATNYDITLKHLFFGLLSDETAAVVGRPRVVATGGTEADAGGYRYHTFNSSDNFIITNQGGRVDILFVGGAAGGGGGATFESSGRGGGGGGAGGLRTLLEESEPNGTHAIVIGAGGAGGSAGGLNTAAANGGNGNTTSYRAESVLGGGFGAGVTGAGNNAGGGGASVGSGGGGAGDTAAPGGTGTVGQGNDGGASGNNPGGDSGGGGGGGKGAVGTAAGLTGGAGGAGEAQFDGNTYARGGDGGRTGTAAAGAANTGNGGGGGNTNTAGTAGGSGRCVIRYLI